MQDACDFIRANQENILKALDQAAGFPPTAAALLSPQDREQIAPDVLQGCLEAEQPFTASPLFTAPVFAQPSDISHQTSSIDHQPSDISHQPSSGLSMLVTPPLL
jgi:hypothetical protein